MTATTSTTSSATTGTTSSAPTAPRGEVVTRALVQDVDLPGDGGTLALVTLDNGLDHTRPNTFGPEGIAALAEVVDTLRTRAAAGEIAAVDIHNRLRAREGLKLAV